ncbi:dTDP-4-dehydrorhamnose 3,5-epimerase [Desulfofundulus thermobenzoicus]|uniref:dTDP-4-dehydrorhamnose 3,5-epimerase n=1 Tax=Desulfofundulus thermobenzoicus TaxID=29376 RepID=A0A6N7IN45_9FIRM|nr:dTDP-4-dehydrorhamnose 3,5-epimerase family protein [Desulfofundulus thermobenzoicus]MQL51402.1 dTDP-4-dehydrorhamnose 3,5-epimerase [Desulfofundulus thermobenzoicus]HHW42661.1 dTDP-4-dehydrorhamnose 3,5-epimerase [Desulfotomaculum sp.]
MQLIEGVVLKPLRLIPDDRGYLMEMLRSDWPEFMKFGQAYITACYPGVIKAWHYHKLQWDHFVCVGGMARVVLYDPRDNSPTRGLVNVFHLGYLNPCLLKIPPEVYHGFTAEGGQTALIVNFPTELYNYSRPDEYRLPYNDPSIPYSWEVRHG